MRKRDGQVIGFDYDALNRVTLKTVPEWGLNVRYTYDLRGLQTSALFTGTGQGVTNAYDGFGRMVSTTTHMSAFVRTVSHQYDREGRRIETTFPDGVKFWTARDGLGRATEHYQGAHGNTSNIMTAFAYNAAGQRSQFYRKYGDNTSYGYDAAGRLNAQNDNFIGGIGNTSSTYVHNPANQLFSESRSNDSYAWTGSVPVSRNYVTNGQNQYTGTTVGGAPGATFTHDANGNLTSSVNPPYSTTYAYDSENRLISASGTENATLTYDPLGRLFQIHSTDTGLTQFLYDGDELVAEYVGWGNLGRRYIHGDSNDDPLFWYEGASLDQPRFPHTNHQGSVIATAGAGAALLSINTYDEYGIPGANQRGVTALGTHGRFQYTGQAWIPELGLYYYKARFYSPPLGRFLQVDPIGYDDQFNLYAYVGNDPMNKVDSSGAWSRDVHNRIFQRALHGRFTAAGIRQIQTVSLHQDIGNNANRMYMHYLRSPGQDAGSAAKQFKKYLSTELGWARSQFRKGNEAAAIDGFARAAHAIADYYSPAHRDGDAPNEYDPNWGPIDAALNGHSPLDSVGNEGTGDLNQNTETRIISQTRAAADRVFGSANVKDLVSCTGSRIRKESC